jgi:hypothetical protein
MYQKNVLIVLFDILAEEYYALGFFCENSGSLLCGLEDGVIHSFVVTMIRFHGVPLMRCVTEFIYRVFEACLYN